MKKTISAAVAAAMLSVMSITSSAAPSLPDILPDSEVTATVFDVIIEFINSILGLVGTIASMLFQ